MIFFLWHSFWEIELTKLMTDQEDKIDLGKNVCDDNNKERKSWACLGQTCSRSLIVFLSQLSKDIPNIYFTLLDAAGISPMWFWIRMPKLKKGEAGSLSKSEHQKLHRRYTQGGAAYGSVRNLVKASNLSVSKVRQFLHSKPSYTKFTLATRKFKRMKAFARFKNEIWYMDLAQVDKVARDNNGVKYLLDRQDLFDRTVDAEGMKTNDSKETVRAFFAYDYKKESIQNFMGWQGNKFCWSL